MIRTIFWFAVALLAAYALADMFSKWLKFLIFKEEWPPKEVVEYENSSFTSLRIHYKYTHLRRDTNVTEKKDIDCQWRFSHRYVS